MASIDQVIARSRQPGGFSEKKRFSVARQRGIRKMREFALADPHYYVLELIQAAVANGAQNVDIRAEKREFGLSYVGGGFTQEELAQLFDFLFASKKDFEHGDIRQLALGVNALMIFEPDSIIVESGDGTPKGTTRIEIRGRDETVDVGTPDEALRGTFIRATGLDRGKVKGKSNLDWSDYGPPETRAIEERCLAAPVPIIVNSEPVFGYATVRTPSVFGYDDVVGFDEGDLYGTIGKAVHAHKRFFKVMTWGVWISSLEHDLLDNGAIGGVVNFDRLNKTADHSGIVQDDTLEELWARLLPYARRSERGESGKAVFQIRPLGGEALHPKELRDMMRQAGQVVVMPDEIAPGSDKAMRAEELGGLLDAPVLCVADRDYEALETLAGSSVRILRPKLADSNELAFFRQPAIEPPARPWLCALTETEVMSVAELHDALYAEEHVDDELDALLDDVLGRSGAINCRIYTPGDDADLEQTDLWMRVLTMERLVWEGPVASSFPGHVVDVEVPAISPAGLMSSLPENPDTSLAQAIAEVTARHIIDELSATAARAIRALHNADVRPGTVAARIALAAIARDGLLRLREPDPEDPRPSLFVSMLEQPDEVDLLELPLLETMGGEALSVSDVPQIMESQRGLLYGVVPDVAPNLNGLDDSNILALSLESERLVTNIVGSAAYVRVDRRDLLASADGLQIRDIAAGIRQELSADLLLETDARAAGDAVPEQTVRDLVSQLVRVAITRPSDSDTSSLARLQHLDDTILDIDRHAEPPEGALGHRRQALWHLQYFLCRRWAKRRSGSDAPMYGLEEMSLFVGDRGDLVTLEQIAAAVDRQGKLVMLDGRSADAFAYGRDIGSVDAGAEPEPCSGIAMNPWLLSWLSDFVDVEPAFDFDLTDEEARSYTATPDEAYWFEAAVEAPGITGRVGVAPREARHGMVAVLESGHGHAHPLRQHSEEYGVVGFARVEKGAISERWSDVLGSVEGAARKVIKQMIEQLPSTDQDTDVFDRMLEVLFGYASRHLELERQPNGRVEARTTQPLADLILDIPLFPTTRGTPVSAQRLVHEFCLEQTRGASVGGPMIIEDAVAPRLRAWIEQTLRPERIIERPHASAAVEEEASIPDGPLAELSEGEAADLLSAWMQRLRPDPYGLAERGDAEEPSSLALDIQLVQPDDRDSIMALSSNAAVRLAQGMAADAPFAYTVGSRAILLINRSHWVWREFREGHQPDSQRLAWMLLSIYAFINEVLEPVTNEHELFFQQRVAKALLDHSLDRPATG